MLYQEEWGSVDPSRRAVRFQGIPGGVARGSIPGRMVASCPIPVGSKQKWCYLRSFVYTRAAWWYQHPWGGERLGGRYTPVERLRRRLRDCLREARLLGNDACWGRLVSPISTTVGGWARRSKAAASGRAASIMTRVSGRWACGSSGYTTPGLSLIASPASRVGQVI